MAEICAVINAPSRFAFAWLGHCSLLERLLDKLEDIREARCVVLTPYLERAEELVRERGEVVSDSRTLLEATMFRSGADVNLVLDPCFPFLDASRIVRAAYIPLEGDRTAAITVRDGGAALTDEGFVMLPKRRWCLSGGCIGAKLSEASRKTEFSWRFGKVEAMEISAIEALDASTENGFSLADSLVNSGAV